MKRFSREIVNANKGLQLATNMVRPSQLKATGRHDYILYLYSYS